MKKRLKLVVHVPKDAKEKPKRIAEEIQRLIFIGQLKAGDQLPSVRDASDEWDQSKDSVHRAYKLLLEKGIIEDSDERGTLPRFIISKKTQQPTEAERLKRLDQLLTQVVSKARKLGYSVEEVEKAVDNVVKKIKAPRKAKPAPAPKEKA